MMADTVPLSASFKKTLKPDTKAEILAAAEAYFQGVKKDVAFTKKGREKYLAFLAPFLPGDQGLGEFKGGNKDPEAWFCWRFQ